MNDKPYTEAQMDLLRRIERMDISNDLREEIQDLKKTHSANVGDIVKGEFPTIGFQPNPK